MSLFKFASKRRLHSRTVREKCEVREIFLKDCPLIMALTFSISLMNELTEVAIEIVGAWQDGNVAYI